MTCWPMLKFPPVNLFSVPVQLMPEPECEHTHWANYVSWGKRTCIDCGIDRPLHDIEIKHQR